LNNLNNNYPTLTDRTFGVELEFVGVRPQEVANVINATGIDCYFEGYHHNTTPYWKLVTDASLDGVGGEIVSPILKGEDGAKQLEQVIAALDTLDNIRVNVQCGLHVHLDVNDLTVGQIQSVYERYADYESQIDMIMPRSRRGQNSRWCRSVTDVKGRIKNVRSKTKAGLAHAAGRYYKVNLQSLTRYGTMEFRQHSGTINFDKIINWVSFLMAFVDTSAKLTTKNKTKPPKSRAYNTLRTLLENNGFNLSYRSGSKRWIITNENTGWFTGFYGEELEELYETNKESSLNKLYAEAFLHENLPADIEFNYSLWNYIPTTDNEIDGGWLDGVDNKVKTFYQERELELN